MQHCNAIIPKFFVANSYVSAAAKSCGWCVSAAPALVWLVTATGASGQTAASTAYGRAATIIAICRQYATTQTGMPVNLMFNQCMSERHCRASPDPLGYQCEAPGPLEWHGGGY